MVSYIAWTAGIRLKKIEYCATVATIHTAWGGGSIAHNSFFFFF